MFLLINQGFLIKAFRVVERSGIVFECIHGVSAHDNVECSKCAIAIKTAMLSGELGFTIVNNTTPKFIELEQGCPHGNLDGCPVWGCPFSED